ncbi:MAG: PD-(D/E)XK nuclease family protein [Gemmatimonadota bacterium]|nr:PD-(D/E)XK nuclease family protein [Gemmatimonadota bacterium]
MLNEFTSHLRDICRDHLIEEKWLLAPSLRVGYQWCDMLTRTGRNLLNVRVKTFPHLALDFAGPQMSGSRLTYLRGLQEEALVAKAFVRIRKKTGGYLSTLAPGENLSQPLPLPLTRALKRAVRDLRLAGLRAGDLGQAAFEVRPKAAEMKSLLAEYESELDRGKLADYAEVLRMAGEMVRSGPGALMTEGALIILPQDAEQEMKGLERKFWEAFPAKMRKVLPVEKLCQPDEKSPGDLGLLRWLERPADAPEPSGDGSAHLFQAVGEANEVREVLRRCVEERIPFDRVEIVHADTRTYVPLVYELAMGLLPGDSGPPPVTFAEGIPAGYSRPGRALEGWLAWAGDGFDQEALGLMIRDGLIEFTGLEEKGYSYIRLAESFYTVRIGRGQERYLEVLDEHLRALARRISRGCPEGDEGDAREQTRLSGQRGVLEFMRPVLEDLLEHTPGAGYSRSGSGRKVLECAEYFLEKHAVSKNQQDNYGREKLLDSIRELKATLSEYEEPDWLDVWEYLAALTAEARVEGKGPRPGCLFVSDLRQGGHSGRGHTFVIGLDDGRFPGAGLQDPLLLDHERRRLSGELATARGRIEKQVLDFYRLLGRLRGKVTLSYCCRNLADESRMFPAPVLLAACRALSGKRGGEEVDYESLSRWLGEPQSFAPTSPERSIDITGWWLWRMCVGTRRVRAPEKVIGEHFPHLGRGFRARDARSSERFTGYDGYVPEAGRDHDPTLNQETVLSASALEMLGHCPLEYFFRYILDIRQPEEYVTDPEVWLDPARKGVLLHGVFREFMESLRRKGLLPELDRDRGMIIKVLDKHVSRIKSEFPPPSPDVFERDCREFRRSVEIFLREEEIFCRDTGSMPFCFEAAIGTRGEGTGTSLDIPEPVAVRLPDGRTIRAAGKIDRLDELERKTGSSRRFAVWDYKTGAVGSYTGSDPFRQGRFVQSALYLALAGERLRKEVSPEAKVEGFGYFFPHARDPGRRLSWTREQLAPGARVISLLCEMISRGCFPFSDDPKDLKPFSLCLEIFEDSKALAGSVKMKLENTENTALEPFRKLRAMGQEEKGDE